LSSAAEPSNEALVFFINANHVEESPKFFVSTLIHEATHMSAFYQNDILRNKFWDDSWLDETFAMMSEDIVVSTVTGFNKIAELRLSDYMLSGANVSLNNWPKLNGSGNHYNMGATLGAFLNRQYGLSIYQQLITGCTSPALLKDSYACLNSLIINNGGVGIADELDKMGASVFSQATASNALAGYGFGSKTSGGYTLQGIDLSGQYLVPPSSLSNTGYGSMSQTYIKDTVSTGQTHYVRNSVRVPAHTNLRVVIR
jgi:hypothetical protein